MKRWVAAIALAIGGAAGAAEPECIRLQTRAEVRQTTTDGRGGEIVRLVSAEKINVGEEVFHTVSATNTCSRPVENVAIDTRVPEHMTYVAGSAIAPMARVLFSVDGGFHFASAGELTLSVAGSEPRVARTEEYTHIRWVLSKPLAAQAVVFARFRAVVK